MTGFGSSDPSLLLSLPQGISQTSHHGSTFPSIKTQQRDVCLNVEEDTPCLMWWNVYGWKHTPNEITFGAFYVASKDRAAAGKSLNTLRDPRCVFSAVYVCWPFIQMLFAPLKNSPLKCRGLKEICVKCEHGKLIFLKYEKCQQILPIFLLITTVNSQSYTF